MAQLICPICQSNLQQAAKSWQCALGHSFDMARQGYVHLLPVQHKKSRAPGDTPEAVAARRAFLHAGFYQPLRDHVVHVLRELAATQVLDIGCGEGYYTSAMRTVADDVVGLDIAKPAVQLAAKQFGDITWLVGSGALLPLADQSVDVVTSLFSPLPVAQMARVLRVGGHVVVATPAPDHLYALRAGLFDDVRLHEPDKFMSHLAPCFRLVRQDELRVPMQLDQASLRNLIAMTPYAWKAKAEKRQALEALENLQTEAVFRVLLLAASPTSPTN